MAITGTHLLFYSSQPDELRATLRDVFGWKSVEARPGWPIYALPPAEIAVHPGEGPAFEAGVRHEISFLCDDIHATVEELRAKGLAIDGEIAEARWGLYVNMQLPGGVRALLYEPRHATAI